MIIRELLTFLTYYLKTEITLFDRPLSGAVGFHGPAAPMLPSRICYSESMSTISQALAAADAHAARINRIPSFASPSERTEMLNRQQSVTFDNPDDDEEDEEDVEAVKQEPE